MDKDILWLVVSVILWSGIHSLLASRPAKTLARRVAGPAADRFYRLAYNLFAGVSFLPVAWLAFYPPGRVLYRFPFPWTLLTLSGQAMAAGCLLVGLLQAGAFDFLGLSQLGSPPAAPPRLFTKGLYRYVRHPLYTAGLVFIWLSPVMTVKGLILFAVLTIYILVGAAFEERRLLGQFGDDYAAYQAVTPMLIPFIKRNKSRG